MKFLTFLLFSSTVFAETSYIAFFNGEIMSISEKKCSIDKFPGQYSWGNNSDKKLFIDQFSDGKGFNFRFYDRLSVYQRFINVKLEKGQFVHEDLKAICNGDSLLIMTDIRNQNPKTMEWLVYMKYN